MFLGVGCMRGRDLAIPGVELDGVLRAVDFLLNANLGYRVELGDDVVVIGGGNVALDAARTALREIAAGRSTPTSSQDGRRELEGAVTQTLDVARVAKRLGARRVRVVALESREEMPAHEFEIEEAEVEGIEVLTRLGPKSIVGRRPRRAGSRRSSVASVFDPDGRFNPRFIDGTESVIECDSVILAIGQAPDLSWLSPDDGVELSPRGTIAIDRDSLATSADGIYAGGDVAFGPRNLIDAIGDGRRAAASIHRQIAGEEPPTPSLVGAQAPADRRGPRPDARLHGVPAGRRSRRSPRERRIGSPEIELGYTREEARAGGPRCLQCFLNIMLEPVDLHPLRRLRRHLPREVHPHHPDRGHRRRRRPTAPSSALIIQEERASAARSASTGARRTRCRSRAGRRPRPPRSRSNRWGAETDGDGGRKVRERAWYRSIFHPKRGDRGERALPVGDPSPVDVARRAAAR